MGEIQLDASSQFSSTTGILPSTFDHADEAEVPVCRKRKRSTDALNLLSDAFVVKPYPSSIQSKPRTLRPRALIDRASLSLSFLDLSSTSTPLPRVRLFESNIKILDLEKRIADRPVVLIARLDDGKSYYAIEFESGGLYALCKLGSWVDIDAIAAVAILSVDLPRTKDYNASTNSIATHAPPNTNPLAPKSTTMTKDKRLAIEELQSILKKPVPQGPTAPGPLAVPLPIAAESTIVADIEPDLHDTIQSQVIIDDRDLAQQTSTDILENIRTQYLDTLYLSKASLAYFVKGPLSRARAAFHLDMDSNLDIKDLITFLDSLALSQNLIDKKYKDALPALITAIENGAHSEHEKGKDAVPKKRRAKKTKLGRNGLYPMEETLIHEWWNNHDSNTTLNVPTGTQGHNQQRERLTHLRVRETQLQMIIILECLAIQSSLPEQEIAEQQLPTHSKLEAIPTIEGGPKTKKTRDLNGLTDMHVDRLCIWQSITEEANAGAQQAAQSSLLDPSSTGHGSAADVLRDFCTEVMVPFFLARLSKKCVEISKRLGVPVTSALERPRLARNSSSKLFVKPGATATRRSAPSKDKPVRTLQRVLTDDRANRRSMSRGSPSALSLMRSQTMPMIPSLKREGSETPSLSSIPPANKRSSWALGLESKDVSSTNSAKDKRGLVDAELKDAIAALKKPNRQLAGQSMVETAERRTLGAMHSKKSKKPIRNPLFQTIQIQATPRACRSKDVLSDSQHTASQFQSQSQPSFLDVVPPSSAQQIPQSVYRSSLQPTHDLSETPIRANKYSQIDTTPVRSLSFTQAIATMTSPSSPFQPQLTISQPIFNVSTSKSNSLLRASVDISESPTKYQHTALDIDLDTEVSLDVDDDVDLLCSNSAQKPNAIEGGQLAEMVRDVDSLYESLGWD